MTNTAVDLRAVAEAAAAGESGVAHGEVLLALAEAMVRGDDETRTRARERVLSAMGPEALVDAVAVASNFERMVRIADSTGIPLDAPLATVSADLREELHLERFGSAANTPRTGWFGRVLGRLLRPLAMRALRRMANRQGGTSQKRGL